MKRLFLTALLCLLGACLGTGSSRVTPELRQTNPRAAIMAVLDAQPRAQVISTEPNLSPRAILASGGWDANAVLVDFLAPRMKGKGLTSVPFSFSASDLAGLYDSSASFPNPASIRPRLCEMAEAQGVDLLLLVYRQMTRGFVGPSIENLVGYGLVKHRDDSVQAYATLEIEVLHSRRCAVVGSAKGQASLPAPAATWHVDYGTDRALLPLAGKDAAELNATLTKVVQAAALTSAQEAGLSF